MEDEEMIELNQKYSQLVQEKEMSKEEPQKIEYIDQHRSIGSVNYHISDVGLSMVIKKSSSVEKPIALVNHDGKLLLGYEPRDETFKVEEPEENEQVDFFARNSLVMVLRNPQKDEATLKIIQRNLLYLRIMTGLAILATLTNIILSWARHDVKNLTGFKFYSFFFFPLFVAISTATLFYKSGKDEIMYIAFCIFLIFNFFFQLFLPVSFFFIIPCLLFLFLCFLLCMNIRRKIIVKTFTTSV
eukprot:TRINITY_DN161_c2_g1_i1.p1 TRINITY_DN161_c2_g1~~TRINITY_DN161_c2_g1_i1.p1  ORF type:complete len:258 (-),score=52.07 TRINITY_DN161_c2_g1_i1:96-824(-)